MELQTGAWFNENLESRNFYEPGVIATIVTLMSLLLTSMAVVREKEIGTMEQTMVTPIRPVELILGKTLAWVDSSMACRQACPARRWGVHRFDGREFSVEMVGLKKKLSLSSTAAMLGFLVTSLGNVSLANANLETTGMEPVYDGIGHFLLTPEDLVPVLSLALYAGLRGADCGRMAMLLLPLAWLVGGIAGMTTGIESSPWITAISFLAIGGLVAADFYMPSFAVSGLTFALGIVHGYLNGALLKDGPGNLGLLGIMAVVFVVVTLASAMVVSIRMPCSCRSPCCRKLGLRERITQAWMVGEMILFDAGWAS